MLNETLTWLYIKIYHVDLNENDLYGICKIWLNDFVNKECSNKKLKIFDGNTNEILVGNLLIDINIIIIILID